MRTPGNFSAMADELTRGATFGTSPRAGSDEAVLNFFGGVSLKKIVLHLLQPRDASSAI